MVTFVTHDTCDKTEIQFHCFKYLSTCPMIWINFQGTKTLLVFNRSKIHSLPIDKVTLFLWFKSMHFYHLTSITASIQVINWVCIVAFHFHQISSEKSSQSEKRSDHLSDINPYITQYIMLKPAGFCLHVVFNMRRFSKSIQLFNCCCLFHSYQKRASPSVEVIHFDPVQIILLFLGNEHYGNHNIIMSKRQTNICHNWHLVFHWWILITDEIQWKNYPSCGIFK